MAHASRGPDGAPRLLPVSAIDYTSGYLMALGILLALVRRSREGGSWQVDVGLARVGRWIGEQGLLPPEVYAAAPAELPDRELAPLFEERDSPLGRLRRLRPIVSLSETPGRWERTAVPLGSHAPSWSQDASSACRCAQE